MAGRSAEIGRCTDGEGATVKVMLMGNPDLLCIKREGTRHAGDQRRQRTSQVLDVKSAAMVYVALAEWLFSDDVGKQAVIEALAARVAEGTEVLHEPHDGLPPEHY